MYNIISNLKLGVWLLNLHPFIIITVFKTRAESLHWLKLTRPHFMIWKRWGISPTLDGSRERPDTNLRNWVFSSLEKVMSVCHSHRMSLSVSSTPSRYLWERNRHSVIVLYKATINRILVSCPPPTCTCTSFESIGAVVFNVCNRGYST